MFDQAQATGSMLAMVSASDRHKTRSDTPCLLDDDFVAFLREFDRPGKLVARFCDAQRRAHARTLLSAQQTARPEFNLQPTADSPGVGSGQPVQTFRYSPMISSAEGTTGLFWGLPEASAASAIAGSLRTNVV